LKNQLRPLQRLGKLLALDRKDITYIYLYAIFSGLITLSLPLGIQAIIGMIAGGSFSSSLVILVFLVSIGIAFAGILTVMQLTVTETLQQRIFTRSAIEFAYRIPRFRIHALGEEYPPELVNRFFDTLTVQKGLPKILMDFSSALLQIIFGLILISFYHPFFVFFSIILLSFLAIIFYLTGPRGLQTSLKESKYKYQVVHWLEEIARNMMSFKLSGDRNFGIAKTDQLTVNYLQARKSHFRILLTQYGAIVLFKVLVTGALLILGSLLVLDNKINIGQFVAAEIVVILVINSVEKLILNMDVLYDVLTGLEKLGAVTDLPLERNGGSTYSDLDTPSGMDVAIHDLTFSHPGAEKPTFKNFNLHIRPNERICLSGNQGSGKSTLIQLIAGMFDEYQGALLYNGIPFKNMDLTSIRAQIGDFTNQEELFRGTIAENICLRTQGVTLTDMMWAARQIGLESYIQQLPNGFESTLMPGGRNVPESIRTKIILARAIVRLPRLLALEPFVESMAQEDRSKLIAFVTDKHQPWTLVAVTNDHEFAQSCDRIVILEEGEVVAEGNWQELQGNPHFLRVFNTMNN